MVAANSPVRVIFDIRAPTYSCDIEMQRPPGSPAAEGAIDMTSTTLTLRTRQLLDRAFTLWNEDEGQDLIEYALAAGLIGLAAVVAMNTLALKLRNAFSNVGSQLTSAV
jgi:pilus assembly protein Flp/PilA